MGEAELWDVQFISLEAMQQAATTWLPPAGLGPGWLRWVLALSWWLALRWGLRRGLRSALGGGLAAGGPAAPPTRPRRPRLARPRHFYPRAA